jgi:ABC-2 type transport system permease protein
LRNTWTVTVDRMRLALRSRPFIFFSLVMPLLFLFLYCGLFARVFFGTNPSGVRFMLGPVLAITVMGSFWGLSVQLVMYREMGILRRFRLAPIGPGAMLASSILSNYFLTLPTVLLEFLIAKWVLHMDVWGNLLSVWILVTLGSIAFAALGLIVASVTNTMQTTQAVNNLIWSAFLFLSGATLPLQILPSWLRHVSWYLPATYLVTGLQSSMISFVRPTQLGPAVLSLVSCACIAFVVSQQLFRWEPETKSSPRAKLWAAATIIPFLLIGSWEARYGHLDQNARADFQLLQRMQPRQQPAQQPPQDVPR